uniref:Disease resistance R13L4/SHOC-2-like LRR domain-containing protein n=1 Tax=Hemiselmis andersenii TaxID=464988 RepID=A0A6U4WLV8_HEMAN|mmetsp:Transcript_7683/g.17591  ORF Transcript_7683/g.17591 Transcript_7683/m.17591 type:complete len:257 (+) Transcript_7683:579-1349(+)
MGGSSSKNDFSNQIGTGSLGATSEQELEIDADMNMLDLRLKKLTSLPWDLAVLSNLQELDLSMNSFQHIPDQCTWKDGHLATSLTKLSINQNIVNNVPPEIGEMKRLKVLCCYDNRITSVPDTMHQMSSLTQLSIYNNALTSLPETFCQIPQLQVAYLSNNRIAKLPDGIGQLTSLRGLYIDGNLLTELPPSFFELPKLRELTLVNNTLNGVPEKLGSMASLEELYLNGSCGRKPVVVPDSIKNKKILKDCYEGQI